MVWIHGGSNVSGNADFYDPSELVSSQDVIVVSINYRLGPFGWFRHPDITSNAEVQMINQATMAILIPFKRLNGFKETLDFSVAILQISQFLGNLLAVIT